MKKILVPFLIAMLLISTQIGTVSAAEGVNIQKENTTISAKDIIFYKTISDNPAQERSNALTEHAEAIKIIENYIKENDFSITTDLDDFSYQQFVLSLGTAFDLFSEEEMKLIVPLVQFIDLYENHPKNDKLKEYQNKLNNNAVLSDDESMELNTLLPVFPNALSTENNVTVDLNEEINENAAAPTANGYNNITARDYAYKWWDGRNPLYDYYAVKAGCKITDKSCWTKWNDCANFVSQALYAGGMKMRKGSSYTSPTSWDYGVVPSYTWGGAHNFYLHWKDRAGVASSVTALQTGDAVNADFTSDGDIDHTAIITKNTGSASSQKFLTQHTTDRKETTTLATWYDSGYKVYGYEIDKASN